MVQYRQFMFGYMASAAALAALALGLVVMMGWHLQMPGLFQLRADLVPMQYNTALGFLLVGAALLSLTRGQSQWARIGAGMAILVGGLTLIQYLFSVDLGIDQLFMHHYVSVQTSSPGRMAPNTALCFVLSGLALVLAARGQALAAGFVVMLMTVLSAIPLLGYVFDVESAYGWAKLTRMAPHTAVGFIVFGFGLSAHVYARMVSQFAQLSISGRLAIGFSAMFGITLAVGLVALTKVDTLTALSTQLDRHAFRASNAALTMKTDLIQISRSMRDLVLYTGAKNNEAALKDIARLENDLFRQLKSVSDNYLGPAEDIEAFKTYFERWRTYGNESLRLLNAGRRDLYVVRTLYDGNRMAEEAEHITDRIVGTVLGNAQRLNAQVQQAREDALHLLLIMLCGALLLAMVISIYITRSIRSQIYGLSAAMAALSDGKADSSIPYQEDRHEIGHMARSVEVFKRYLKERNRLQDRFQLIVESSPYGMLMVGPGGKIGMLNQQSERLFGYTREELIGQPMECLLPERFRAAHPQQRDSFMASPSVRSMAMGRNLLARRKDGSEFPVEIGLNPIETEDGSMVLATIVDVSERQAAEQALKESHEHLVRHSQALERSNKELDTFAYVASHDLKSPLRGIDQLATWISEDLGEDLSPETQNYVRLMRVRVNRMEHLLNDLLAYSRVGRQEYQLVEVDTRVLAQDIFSMLSHPETIRLDVREPMPTFVTLRVPLELVLRNLINNAIKHHDKPQGTITVSAQKVDDDMFAFEVADDGPGIPVVHQERVFGIFQTLRPRDDVEGSGMGLAIVKKAVENFGGTITLTSDGIHGSRFKFTWPNEAAMRKRINEQ